MNTIKVCNIRGIFTNIYQWGEGWNKEISDKWDKYLESYNGIFWHPVKIKDIWYLVSTHGSIYLHPMDFNSILKSSGGCSPKGNDDMLEDYFGDELEELKELCSGLAKECGGQFTSLVAEAQKLDNDNLRQLV